MYAKPVINSCKKTHVGQFSSESRRLAFRSSWISVHIRMGSFPVINLVTQQQFVIITPNHSSSTYFFMILWSCKPWLTVPSLCSCSICARNGIKSLISSWKCLSWCLSVSRPPVPIWLEAASSVLYPWDKVCVWLAPLELKSASGLIFIAP